MFEVKLGQIADIIQGNIQTRIEVEIGHTLETITMQELNYVANVSDELPSAKFLAVQHNKLNFYSLTILYDVVIGLNSGNAIVIEQDRANKLILSNLAIIRIKDFSKVDPYYLCWYINNYKAEINRMRQKTAAVSIIPLSKLKSLDIVLLPFEKQRVIGNISELKRRRDRISRTLETKKSDVLSQQIIKLYEKESKHGKK